MRYRIVDVFSDRPLAGNALCVVLDDCPDAVMQSLARETNLSETTYPVVTGPGAYRMRIFTPSAELPFAGHPSIGTAWALGPGRWEQTTKGAVVAVTSDSDGAVMGQPDPVLEEVTVDRLADALGVAGVDCAYVASVGGNRFLLAPTASRLAEARPDHAALAGLSLVQSVSGIAAVARITDRELHVRVFVPSAGIPEDPGTGGVAGAIGVLARRRWGTDTDVTIRQGAEVGRPCHIQVHAELGSVQVGGRVAACAEGRFEL